ncbi:MAG: PE-PPE domain-containing protein [Mycolicibacterium sp.]|nr:PE-PPE domain-containing protein [Mycolicibacterium sp.]
MGILLVHTRYTNPNYFGNTYRTVDPLLAEFGPGTACQGSSTACLQLPTTAGTEDSQEYYFIQTPTFRCWRRCGRYRWIGTPLADLIQPALKVIVDLGYADWGAQVRHRGRAAAGQRTARIGCSRREPPRRHQQADRRRPAGNQRLRRRPDARGSVAQELSMMASTIQKVTSDTAATITALASQPFTLPSLSDVVTTVQNVVSEVTSARCPGGFRAVRHAAPLADFANALCVLVPGPCGQPLPRRTRAGSQRRPDPGPGQRDRTAGGRRRGIRHHHQGVQTVVFLLRLRGGHRMRARRTSHRFLRYGVT